MAKATINIDERPVVYEVRDEWDELADSVNEVVELAIGNTPRPERITISISGMSILEWEALPEETRRDFQDYGAND